MNKTIITLLVGLIFSFTVSAQLILCVDMQNETVNPAGVSVAGNFQAGTDWTPGVDFLTDPDNDLVYCDTFSVADGIYEYKFVNGTSWGQEESVPGACSVGNYNNRQIVVSGLTQPPTLCFASCNPCINTINVKFQVDMSNEVVNASGVSVAGSFQNWSPGTTLLTDDNNDNIYEVTVSMDPGTYQFKYVNGISPAGYETDIPASCTVGGYGNRFFTVSVDTCLPVVCFEECTDCSIVVPGSCSDGSYEYADIASILQTNCSDAAGGGACHTNSYSGFDLAAGYNGLLASGTSCGPIITPGDTANSSLIQKTKWVTGGSLPSCGGSMPVGFALSVNEFNAINQWVLDGAIEFCPVDKSITFCVDMSCSGLSYSAVYVSGTFNAWDPSIDSLVDNGSGGDMVAGDSIYCKTVVVPDGDYEYTFQTDGFTNSESFSGLELCPTNTNYNRDLTVSADTTVAFAWNSCETDCSVVVPDYNITFQVNMCSAIYYGDFDPVNQAVFVAGGNANQTGYGNDCGVAMTDADEDGVYEITNSYPNGYVIIYKYYIGSPSDSGTSNCNVDANYESSLGPCGFGYYGDRSYTVNGTDDTVGPFCFGDCFDCNGNCNNYISCIPIRHVSGQLYYGGIYEADDILTSDATINQSTYGDVYFQAGDDYIELQSGFSATGNFNFNALIVDCNPGN